MELFGSSGVRGVVGEEMTPAVARDVAAAAATVLGADRVALARDTRTTGPMLAAAATSGLAGAGADVDRLGVLPTPGLADYAARESVPGVMVTASHNPPEYNGIKLVGTDGGGLSVADLEAVEAALDGGCVGWEAVGDVRRVEGATEGYLRAVLADVDREAVAEAAPTVAVDPGNGAGAHTSPELFRRLGCRVVTVNAEADGRFPGRAPEPVPEALADLRRLVGAADADLGVAHDGDGDRATFVDETGRPVSGDAALAALAAADLEAGDVVVGAADVSRRLADVVDERDARLELTPIGSTRITTRVRELHEAGERVPVAGEGNGGVFFPRRGLARDAAYTAARFLELAVAESASAVADPHTGYHVVRETVAHHGDDERAAMLAAAGERAEAADTEVTTIDGYRIEYDDGWVLARGSGTEPLLRVTAEAATEQRAAELAADMVDVLRGAREDARV